MLERVSIDQRMMQSLSTRLTDQRRRVGCPTENRLGQLIVIVWQQITNQIKLIKFQVQTSLTTHPPNVQNVRPVYHDGIICRWSRAQPSEH
jgi:hypothetical protein